MNQTLTDQSVHDGGTKTVNIHGIPADKMGNVPGKLGTQDALDRLTAMGLHPREILREVEKTHIFTHIQWNMKGIYLETAEIDGSFRCD